MMSRKLDQNRTDAASIGPSPALRPGEIPWLYSAAEVSADAVVHALGIGLVSIGAVVLATALPNTGGAILAAVAVYLATLMFSIVVSAAYNLWPVSPTKWLLRRFDHSAIYLLIAGTYTPLMVRVGMGWLLAMVWAAAGLGVTLKVFRPGHFDRLSIALYLALGWSGILVLDKLMAAFAASTLWLIGAGGLVYSLGVIFHVWESLRFQNAIWHGFVLTGASLHYAAVWSAIRSTGSLP